jgi:[ribosomal protein S18]-alanine N-acetyltransferase
VTGYTIAPLRREDVPRCAELERVLFPDDDPWRENAFHAELDMGHHYLGAYDEQGRLLGYAGLALLGRRPDLEASVHTIAVDPAAQGSGVGTALLRALLDRADDAAAPTFLEVRTDNDRAIALYQAHDFEAIGVRRRYYQPSGADAYTMARPARVSGRTA